VAAHQIRALQIRIPMSFLPAFAVIAAFLLPAIKARLHAVGKAKAGPLADGQVPAACSAVALVAYGPLRASMRPCPAWIAKNTRTASPPTTADRNR
jgi:hypothetical protein